MPADDEIFTRMVVMARQKYGLKLPDAIIAATDLDGNPRANGRRVSIGCYQQGLKGLAIIVY